MYDAGREKKKTYFQYMISSVLKKNEKMEHGGEIHTDNKYC